MSPARARVPLRSVPPAISRDRNRDRKTQQTLGVSRLSRLSRLRAHIYACACSSIYFLPGQKGQVGQTAVWRGFGLSRLSSRSGTSRDSAA